MELNWIKSNRISRLSAFCRFRLSFPPRRWSREPPDVHPPVRRWRIGSCDVPALLWEHLNPNQLRIRCWRNVEEDGDFLRCPNTSHTQLTGSRPGKVGGTFFWFHIAESVGSSCVHHLKVFYSFQTDYPVSSWKLMRRLTDWSFIESPTFEIKSKTYKNYN